MVLSGSAVPAVACAAAEEGAEAMVVVGSGTPAPVVIDIECGASDSSGAAVGPKVAVGVAMAISGAAVGFDGASEAGRVGTAPGAGGGGDASPAGFEVTATEGTAPGTGAGADIVADI